MSASNPPALPGEMWRGVDEYGMTLAVAPWLGCPVMVWAWCGNDRDGYQWMSTADVGEEQRDTFALRSWGLAERARANRAEEALREFALLAEEDQARRDMLAGIPG